MRNLLFIVLATATAASAAELIAGERFVLTGERILPAMQRALGNTPANIEIVDMSQFPVPEGEVEFALKDLNPPSSANSPVRWRGYIREGDTKTFAIWAMVRIKGECTRVIAEETLEVGRPILPEQIRQEAYLGFPFARNASVALADIVGRAPLRTLRSGSTVSPDATTEPVIVASGADLTAEFRSGRLRVTAPVVAIAAGKLGDIISVRNPSSKKIFAARIQSSGRVIVELGQ